MLDKIQEIQRVVEAFPLPHSPLVTHLRRLVDELEREAKEKEVSKMNINLKNAISNIRPQYYNLLIDELYKNLVEMMARVKLGDIAAVDEFCALYCMENDVKAWQEMAKQEGCE